MKVATFSSIWGTSTGGIDVFNKGLVEALASDKSHFDVFACLQVRTRGLEADSKTHGFKFTTPEDATSDAFPAESLGEWSEAQARAVTLRMLLEHKFEPEYVFLNDIFCKSVLKIIRTSLPNAKVITFFHSAYGRSEKKKNKPDSELERKSRFQAEMVRESDLALAVGSFSKAYLEAITPSDDAKIDYIVPGLPNIKSRAKQTTHFNAMSFGRLDPISDNIKQIRLSAMAWNEARLSGHISKLNTSDVTFYAVGARGNESVLGELKESLATTWRAGVYELPFEDVTDFEKSDLKRRMDACSFVLLNSWYENFGLTYLETCSFGTPTIISESSGFLHELENIIGKDNARNLTITVPTDGLEEQSIVEQLKIKLIVSAEKYPEVFNNAATLSSLIRTQWPSWKKVVNDILSAIKKHLSPQDINSSAGVRRARTEQEVNPSIPPWDEKISDLFDWCWRKNASYREIILNESDIKSTFDLPLTNLQKRFWDQRDRLTEHNFKDLVLSGGTSSGKTTLAEYLFGISRPHEFARSRILYIAPTKALAQERAKMWREIYPSTNLKTEAFEAVIVSTGDNNVSDGALMRGDFNVACTVYEKANVILSASQELFSQLNLVIIDEFHMIDDLHRGSVIECLLAKVKLEKARRIESVDEDNHLRIIVITTENPGIELSRFLTFRDFDLAEDIPPLVLVDSTRAKPVTHYSLFPGRTNSFESAIFDIRTFEKGDSLTISREELKSISSRYEDFRRSLRLAPEDQGFDPKRLRLEYYKEFVDWWMNGNKTGRRLLVFMNSKYEIVEFAKFIKNYIVKNCSYDAVARVDVTPNDEGIKLAIDCLLEVESTDFNQDIKRCAEEGVFIHNADVPQKVRANFESYLGKHLPSQSRSELVIATETLSYGVNLKVTDVVLLNVLFPEVERIQTGKPKSILLSRCDFANMSGRAGRLGQRDASRDARVYWYLDPEEEKSFERVLEEFYISPSEFSSKLFYRSDARVLANLATKKRQSMILEQTVENAGKSGNYRDYESNDRAVEEFSYPFVRSVLDGLRFLGGTESTVGFLGKIGCSEDDVITKFFFDTLYYSNNCRPSDVDSDRRATKEKELISAARLVISSASHPVYNLVRTLSSGGYLISPLGCSTIDTGTEIATVTMLRHSLLTLNSLWTRYSNEHLPFELATLPVFFQPEVHRQYLGRLPEFRHAMAWNGAENRADLIDRAVTLLNTMNVVDGTGVPSAKAVLSSFMGWALVNQPVQSEQGHYEEAPHDSCLRLFVAFLSWISGASLRNVIKEIQRLYPSSQQTTRVSVFNFESFAENLTWKILFLVSLIRASNEKILPAKSTFSAVRFVHRSRFGCTEQAIPLLFRNKNSLPPLNRVQAHSLLREGFSSAAIAVGQLEGQSELGAASERKIREHVRIFIKESFQELARQFSYLASGIGLNKANEDISKEYWSFALTQVNALISSGNQVENRWVLPSAAYGADSESLVENDDSETQARLIKVEQGVRIEIYSPIIEGEESERIRIRKVNQYVGYYSFGDVKNIDDNMGMDKKYAIVVDFPWAAGSISDIDQYCRMSPAAFGIFLSLCARRFIADIDVYIQDIMLNVSEKPIDTRKLYIITEPHLKKGGFPESLFESWAKYIEVGEFVA